MPTEYFKKKGQSNSFKMSNPYSGPFKKHDGTESSETHNTDGSPRTVSAGGSETEGQDENKILDNEGNQIGYWKGDTKYNMDGTPMEEETASGPLKQQPQLGVDPAMMGSTAIDPTLGGGMNDPTTGATGAFAYKKKKVAPKMTYQSPKGELTKDR